MTKFQILIIRICLGAAIGIILMRMFYPNVHPIYVGGLCVFLIGAAYLREYLRGRKSNKK